MAQKEYLHNFSATPHVYNLTKKNKKSDFVTLSHDEISFCEYMMRFLRNIKLLTDGFLFLFSYKLSKSL